MNIIPRLGALVATMTLIVVPRLYASPLRSVAVIALDPKGVSATDAAVLSESLTDELLKLGSVQVMERSQMDRVLAEQGFQQTGVCDGTQCAVEMGKVLGIDAVVLGTVGKIGETYTISTRLVDVETGKVLAGAKASRRGSIDAVLSGMPELARSLQLSAGDRLGRPTERSWTPWILAAAGTGVAGGLAAWWLLSGDEQVSAIPDAKASRPVMVVFE